MSEIFDRDQEPTPDEPDTPDADESDGHEIVVPEDMKVPTEDEDDG